MAKRRAQKSSSVPLILIGAGLLLIVGLLAWMALSNNGQVAADPYASIQRVSLKEAKDAYDQKTAVFVDVRAADSYQASHVPGALNIPLAELPNRMNELKKDAWIITYCT